jgi:hypothetical protein
MTATGHNNSYDGQKRLHPPHGWKKIVALAVQIALFVPIVVSAYTSFQRRNIEKKSHILLFQVTTRGLCFLS